MILQYTFICLWLINVSIELHRGKVSTDTYVKMFFENIENEMKAIQSEDNANPGEKSMPKMVRLSALHVGTAFSGIVPGMSRKLPKLNAQLCREIEGEDEDAILVHLGTYTTYMQAMKWYHLGIYNTILPNGYGRKVNVEETLQMILKHQVHFQELLDQKMCRFYSSSPEKPD